MRAHLPNGFLVTIAGDRDVTDPGAGFVTSSTGCELVTHSRVDFLSQMKRDPFHPELVCMNVALSRHRSSTP